MIININDDWRITHDTMQWIVERRRKRSTSVPSGRQRAETTKVWARVGYSRDVAQAARIIFERAPFEWPNEYDRDALEPLIQYLDGVRADIKAALDRMAEQLEDRDLDIPDFLKREVNRSARQVG